MSYLDEFKREFNFKDLNCIVVDGKHKIWANELEKGFTKAR